MKNKIKICGHIYTIVADDQEYRTGGTELDTGTIKIRTTPPLGVQEETLIHEIIHCIYFHASERDWNKHQESLIQAIANGLWQAGIRPKHFNVDLPDAK